MTEDSKLTKLIKLVEHRLMRFVHGFSSGNCLRNPWCLLIALALYLSAMHNSVQAQQLSFNLFTTAGDQLELKPGSSTATVVCFLGTECPMARGYATQLNRLHSTFASRGVRLIGVMSNRQDSVEDIARYADDLSITFPLVHDVGGQVADRYGAKRTPEVFLLDAELKLRYHGRVDDQLAPGVARNSATREDLRIAIEELLAGKPISIPATKPLGCFIGRAPSEPPATSTAGQVTYSKQVARVLQRHCVECHRPGEIGPFAMDNYDEIVGWAETMLETVEQGRMPPWHADPQFGNFSNARSMPEADKQILRDWIAAGLPQGLAADLPPEPTWVEGWNLTRPPDLVVDMRARPFTVPKDGVVEYQYFVADPGLKQDTWVTAAQVIPGARSVVHHAIVFVRPPDGAEFRGIGWLTAYVPGQRVSQLPPGRARKIPAGSKFVFQMHYTPNGVEQDDITKVGLLLGEQEQVTHEVFTTLAIDQEFEIPPGEANFSVRAKTIRLPTNGELLAITPHMHVRGKSFRLFDAQRASDTILSVPQYDFNWQHTYQLVQPLALDAFEQGLEFEAVFDNSTNNPFNPDPTETVTWGDQTWEEMAVAFFEVARPLKAAQSTSSDSSTDSVQAALQQKTKDIKIEKYVQRVFAALDANDDGQIKKAEADIVVRHLHFDLWDLNGDNVATLTEVQQAAQRLYQ